MHMGTHLIAGFLGLALLAQTTASSETEIWRPKGDYWDTYRTVIVKADCDSTGIVQHAEIVFSAASPAEADSVLSKVKQTRFDPSTSDGRVRRGKYERSPGMPDLQFIVPYAIRDKKDPVKPLVNRKELEQAGLGPWLAIWDRLIPDWPVESWSRSGIGGYYEYTSTIDDSKMVSLGMVSISPDQNWHLHPFYGAEFSSDGKVGFDVDGGFLLYPLGDSVLVRQLVTGTTVNYGAAEWIDNHRFVVTTMETIHLYHGGKITFHHFPGLILGDVNSSKLMSIDGPPVPIEISTETWKRLDEYKKARYPKLFALMR